MSRRYEWPRSGGKADRALMRARHVARRRGFVSEAAIAEAIAVREAFAPAPAIVPRRRGRRGRVVPEEAPSDAPDLWVPIGPSEVLTGQAGSSPRVAGRVRDLAVGANGQRAYAATASGGVWYTNDGATTWSALGNWAPTPGSATLSRAANALICGCLLVHFGDPADGSDDIVYVGTGEVIPDRQGTPGAQLGGVGVLRLNVPLATALSQPFINPWVRQAPELVGAGIFRLAWAPNDRNHIVAATSQGLYRTLNASAGQAAVWTKIKQDPFDFEADDAEYVTDVTWSSSPTRLWVAFRDDTRFSDTGVYMSNNGSDGPFHEIGLDDVVKTGRLGLAVAPSDQSIVYVLGRGPRLWRINGITSERVKGVPQYLFGETNDQSAYDLTLAVDPTDAAVVVLGGSTLSADGEWSASLFKCTVIHPASGLMLDFLGANQATPTKDSTFIGNGVHADVHAARFIAAPGGMELWIGCDGGVFRSRANGRRHSFAAVNGGLAVLECGYVACHPTNDALVVAGTQDNGTVIRVGDTLWERWTTGGGDGGGIAFHPNQPSFFVRQYTRASWKSNGRLTPPILRANRAVTQDTKDFENGYYASSFYSGCAMLGNRLALGTHRVWMVDNWNPSPPADAAGIRPLTQWVTLPTKTDPLPSNNITQDVFEGGGSVLACRWGDENRLYALCERAVLVFDRNAVDDKWTRRVISHHTQSCSFDNDDISQPHSTFLPPLGGWSDLAVYQPRVGDHGSFYVATTGFTRFDGDTPHDADRMDTLWFYNGSGGWLPTGLRASPTGTRAPAYAVACDPDDPNIVYVGTALGVWRARFNEVARTWDWAPFVNGLPEAAVHDLSFHSRAPVKLLRAAVQARGVWEVDVSAAPSPRRRTYLRVHAYDARRVTPAALTNPSPAARNDARPDDFDPVRDFSWHASPDVRIRLAPNPATPPPWPGAAADVWINAAPSPYLLWVFQTALHATDPLCRPTGNWTESFNACLRRIANAGNQRIDQARWTAVVTAANVFRAPWNGLEPAEADLHELIVERRAGIALTIAPAVDRDKIAPIMRSERAPHIVDVLVHHRDSRPVARADVRVAVLSRPMPADPNTWGGIAISDEWKARVAQLMSGAALPPGFALPDSWNIADPARTRQPGGDVDARLPRVVSFNVDFSPRLNPDGTQGVPPDSMWILLAVVHAANSDPVAAGDIAGATLQDVVRGSHHFAARVVRVS